MIAPLEARGILGNGVIHDNCHPDLPAHMALADTIVRTLCARDLPRAWPPAPAARGTR
jgi:hypothetical protein